MRNLAVFLLRAVLSAVLAWYLLVLPIAALAESLGISGVVHGGWLLVLVWPCLAVVFWLLGFIRWFRSSHESSRRHNA
jgi:hypothetical protein